MNKEEMLKLILGIKEHAIIDTDAGTKFAKREGDNFKMRTPIGIKDFTAEELVQELVELGSPVGKITEVTD